MIPLRIDLNCDAGEGAGRDAELMPHITSVNIACGEHAGDLRTMHETLALARLHGVAAGAHPGYPDREGFGRRHLDMTPGEIYDTVFRQITTLCDAAREEGVPVTHVKPHGALYNDAVADSFIARAVVRAVNDAAPDLLLYGLAGSRIITEAERVGLRAIAEAFADRAYERDGTLTPRGAAGAVITDPQSAAARVVRMVTERAVRTTAGTDLKVHADTVCIHGDGPAAVDIAVRVRAALLDADVRVAAPGAS
jgi:5-oxoprolinase (ATP-hydrolysing) subunit A